MPRLGKQFESKRCVSGIEAIGSKPAILCSLVALVRYLFIGWETNWMAFNIIKVDRHSGIACQNLQRCLIQIDPRNGSSTNRESLGHGPNACSPFPNRVLTFYFEKMKRHLISISGSVALFTFSPFTPANIWQLCCQKNQLLRSQDRPARLGSGYCNFASSRQNARVISKFMA